MNYNTYPEGFDKLSKDLDIPFETEEQRKAFVMGLMDTLIKL